MAGNEVAETGVPNPVDMVQICFRGHIHSTKIKEKLGKVLPCCFCSHGDSSESQEELDKMVAPFRKYCSLELSAQQEQLHEIKKQLGDVLTADKVKYESLFQYNPRQLRKQWRDKRIKIYDYLLYLALYDPNQSVDLRIEGQESTRHFSRQAKLKLEPERFYTYLVDQVHEDEEIMSKFYCVDNGDDKPFKWRMKAPWLVRSLKAYCYILIRGTLDALRDWDDKEKTLCDGLVKKAKVKFETKMLSLHGRCFKKDRNWRNRARLYYLLGLARHTGISNGRAGKFKNFEYEGPFCRLVREMIADDRELFEQESEDQDLPRVCKKKYGKNGAILGQLKVDSLLAWASAANDLGFVREILKYYLVSLKENQHFDFQWEQFMGKSWVHALWNATYRGQARIVKELLICDIPYHSYYSEYFSDNTIEPPLHIAVQRKYILVVEAFCTTASKHLNCNEKNLRGLTPLEIATKLEETDDKAKASKRKIQNLLLHRQEVKDAVAEASNQRQLVVDFSNAIMVGGTLIAGITFGGWLSPPLGYNSYYQFVEPAAAAPPDSYESYMSVQGHLTVQLFAIFNSLSFFLAIAAVVAGMETFGSIKVVEDTYMAKTVKKLQRKLFWATILFLASVLCVLVAFACAGIAILPPIKQYQTNMYITISVGGFVCVLFICKMLWYGLPRNLRNKVKSKPREGFDKLNQKLFPDRRGLE